MERVDLLGGVNKCSGSFKPSMVFFPPSISASPVNKQSDILQYRRPLRVNVAPKCLSSFRLILAHYVTHPRDIIGDKLSLLWSLILVHYQPFIYIFFNVSACAHTDLSIIDGQFIGCNARRSLRG